LVAKRWSIQPLGPDSSIESSHRTITECSAVSPDVRRTLTAWPTTRRRRPVPGVRGSTGTDPAQAPTQPQAPTSPGTPRATRGRARGLEKGCRDRYTARSPGEPGIVLPRVPIGRGSRPPEVGAAAGAQDRRRQHRLKAVEQMRHEHRLSLASWCHPRQGSVCRISSPRVPRRHCTPSRGAGGFSFSSFDRSTGPRTSLGAAAGAQDRWRRHRLTDVAQAPTCPWTPGANRGGARGLGKGLQKVGIHRTYWSDIERLAAALGLPISGLFLRVERT
jgi:hypothetical protein